MDRLVTRPCESPLPTTNPKTFYPNPLSKDFHLFESRFGPHILTVDRSKIFDLDRTSARNIRQLLEQEDDLEPWVGDHLRAQFAGLANGPAISSEPIAAPPLRSLSLNVAQSCNLACKYCYADGGAFGGRTQMMPFGVAEQAIERLLMEAEPGVDLVIGFMGGEPLLNRGLIHHIANYASRRGRETQHPIRFSLTTNATLVTPSDASLFARHRFNISVSIDGPPGLNNLQRPTHSGRGSYDATLKGLKHLLSNRPAHLSARSTVTPLSGRLLSILEHSLELGVDDAGFAPVLVSPDREMAFKRKDFEVFLNHMIECGEACKQHLLKGSRFPFTNFETALNEIHRGSHRPYPCGAGAAYLSVNARGKLYACHRLVDAEDWAMGSVQKGSDLEARQALLNRTHVDGIEPCCSCWARYLCGGGCYHEVSQRGRIGCDYIRGWLDFCLTAYAELSTQVPQYFCDANQFFASVPPPPLLQARPPGSTGDSIPKQ